jgi:hypothetical protein
MLLFFDDESGSRSRSCRWLRTAGADLMQDERIARRLRTKFGNIYFASGKKSKISQHRPGVDGCQFGNMKTGPLVASMQLATNEAAAKLLRLDRA